jgi:surface polysaccharide O-acyltransferase-like enzyme
MKPVIWVDFIRVMATFLVVWLHSTAPILYKFNEIPMSYWWIGNLFNSFVRMCVPLFFMVSGYLLIEKTEDLRLFYKKRIKRVFVPMVAWSLIYVFWKACYENSSALSFHSFYSIFYTPAYHHLWFLYAIMGLYLYMPILRIFVRNSDRMHLYYFVALWILAASLIPFAQKVTGIRSKIDLKMISGFIGYLVIGHLLGRIKIRKILIGCSIFGFVICGCATAYGTFYLSQQGGKFIPIFYNYLSPNIVILSVASFILLRAIGENTAIINHARMAVVLPLLSSASFGIYLIHTMFLFVLRDGLLGCQLNVVHCNPLYAVPLTAVISFSLSLVAVVFLKKIPYVRNIVP